MCIKKSSCYHIRLVARRKSKREREVSAFNFSKKKSQLKLKGIKLIPMNTNTSIIYKTNFNYQRQICFYSNLSACYAFRQKKNSVGLQKPNLEEEKGCVEWYSSLLLFFGTRVVLFSRFDISSLAIVFSLFQKKKQLYFPPVRNFFKKLMNIFF